MNKLKSLSEIQAEHHPKATLNIIGITITSGLDTESEKAAVAALEEYLGHFVFNNKCLKCQAPIGGLLGRFEYDLAYGEGHCSDCGYPMRAQHDIKGFGKMNNIILQYHPDELSEASKDVAAHEKN